jgi:hypothetical protein
MSFPCDEQHPTSFERSDKFRNLIGTRRQVPRFHSDALRGIPFPAEAAEVVAYASDAIRSIPFHSGAVRSSGILLGRSEGFRHFTPML